MPEAHILQQPHGRPLLTIAVPTYNRSANLKLLLGFIGPQLAALPQIELLVSDNASPDDTEAVMNRLLNAGLRCRYIRNATNIGADPNFLQCYRQAAGKYLWIFGDDDVIFPGALAHLVHFLAAEEPELVYLAPFGFVDQPNERGLANPAPVVYAFDNPAAMLHAVGLRGDLILLSAVIVNRDIVEAHPHPDFAEGRDTNLMQLGWTFSALRRLRCGLLFEHGLYSVCELNPQRRFDVVRVFGVHWAQAVARYFGQDDPMYRVMLNDQLYSWFTTNWYGMRRHPEHTIIHDPVGQMRPLYGRLPLFWVCVWPLLAWPMPLAGAWLALWRGIRKADLWRNRRSRRALT